MEIFIVLGAIVLGLIAILTGYVRKKEKQNFEKAWIIDYSFYTKVVGVTYEGRQQILPKLHANMPIIFRREPDNPYDSNAVAVICNKYKIGHLAADIASDIAEIMDKGIPVKGSVKEITGGGAKSYGCNIEVIVYKALKEKE